MRRLQVEYMFYMATSLRVYINRAPSHRIFAQEAYCQTLERKKSNCLYTHMMYMLSLKSDNLNSFEVVSSSYTWAFYVYQ